MTLHSWMDGLYIEKEAKTITPTQSENQWFERERNKLINFQKIISEVSLIIKVYSTTAR